MGEARHLKLGSHVFDVNAVEAIIDNRAIEGPVEEQPQDCVVVYTRNGRAHILTNEDADVARTYINAISSITALEEFQARAKKNRTSPGAKG